MFKKCHFMFVMFFMVACLGCNALPPDNPVNGETNVSGKSDIPDETPIEDEKLQFTESEIIAVEEFMAEYFHYDWLERSAGCQNPKFRVNITSQPKNSSFQPKNGSFETKMFFRCPNDIQWEEHEVCMVVYKLDPTTNRPSDFKVDYCDI